MFAIQDVQSKEYFTGQDKMNPFSLDNWSNDQYLAFKNANQALAVLRSYKGFGVASADRWEKKQIEDRYDTVRMDGKKFNFEAG